MRGLRRNRRLLSWLAVIALLGNALAIALLPRPAVAVTAIDELLGTVVVCTADGAKTLHGGGSGPGGNSPADHCPACVTVVQLALAVVPADPSFPMVPVSETTPAWEQPSLYRLRPGGISARAPPLFA